MPDTPDAQDRPRDLNAILPALIERLPDAVIYIGGDEIVRYANARWEELFGVPAAAMIGRHTSELRPRIEASFADPDGYRRRRAESSAAGRNAPLVERLADGRTIERIQVPVPAADGPSARLVLMRDVTVRRGIEERLLQAQKMESVGRLAGGIAHDFNNMLTAMIGYMDLVAAGLAEGSEERGYLAQALEAAEQATHLTRQLLAFSRQQPAPPSPQDLNALLQRMAPMIRRMVPASIEIVTRAGANPAWVQADAGQLEQVLVNLVLNARDAMPEGGVLTLSTANPPPSACGPPGLVALVVADTGVGIDADALQHVFDPFFTTKSPGQGSGLGLTSVLGTVTAWGGRVEAASEPGRGATFTVLLPTAVSTAPPAPAADEGAAAGRGTVLLVEDEASVRGLITAMLERLGYRVLAAERADEALRLLERSGGAVDLLLADIVMPGTSGRALALEALARHPRLRVLLVSGYAPAHGDAPGVAGLAFLAKPFSIETLARRVRETLAAPAPVLQGRGVSERA